MKTNIPTSTRQSNILEYNALDSASRVNSACSTFNVTSILSDLPPHLLSIFRLVSFICNMSCCIPNKKAGKSRTEILNQFNITQEEVYFHVFSQKKVFKFKPDIIYTSITNTFTYNISFLDITVFLKVYCRCFNSNNNIIHNNGMTSSFKARESSYIPQKKVFMLWLI